MVLGGTISSIVQDSGPLDGIWLMLQERAERGVGSSDIIVWFLERVMCGI